MSRTELATTDAPILRAADGQLSLHFADGAVQSRVHEHDATRLALEYTRLMMGFLLFQPTPARIAMIGLGGGALAKYCALKLPDTDFTAIEISPAVIGWRDAFGIPPDGDRFRVLCDDGAAFVRRDGEPFDVLLIDGFDRTGVPEQLGTAAFYDACRRRLTLDGVLVVNLYADDVMTPARVDRMRTSFDGRIITIEANGSHNTVVFAGEGRSFPPAFQDMVTNLRALHPVHPVDLDVTLQMILHPTIPPRLARNPRRPRSRTAAQ